MQTPSNQAGNANKLKDLLSPSNIQDEDFEGANIGDNLEKLPPKKKLFINCALDKKIFSLPTEA